MSKPNSINSAVYLVIGIPAAAVLMGAITLYIAFSNPDPGVPKDGAPLSRTSWQETE